MPNIGGGIGYRPWKICGALGRIPFNGGFVYASCTRFEGHLTKAKRDPLKHFDERTKRSWIEEKPTDD